MKVSNEHEILNFSFIVLRVKKFKIYLITLSFDDLRLGKVYMYVL